MMRPATDVGQQAVVSVKKGDGTETIYRGHVYSFNYDDDGGYRSAEMVIQLEVADPFLEASRIRPGARTVVTNRPVMTRTEFIRNINNKESTMKAKYNVEIIRDKKTKSAHIYVELVDKPDTYLVRGKAGVSEAERAEGAEMPLYQTIPDELFVPLMRAAVSSEYRDAPTASFQ
jgi:hypothetical protein